MSELKSVFGGSNNNNRQRNNRRNNNNNRGGQQMDYGATDDIKSLTQQLEARKAQLAATCTHTTKRGESTLVPVSGNPEYVRCEQCKVEFRHQLITDEELSAAVLTVFSAVQQIRGYATNSQEDSRHAQSLGELGYSIKRVPELYNNLTNSLSRGRNRRKRNNNQGTAASYDSALRLLNIE